jgi:hypothetical protein
LLYRCDRRSHLGTIYWVSRAASASTHIQEDRWPAVRDQIPGKRSRSGTVHTQSCQPSHYTSPAGTALARACPMWGSTCQRGTTRAVRTGRKSPAGIHQHRTGSPTLLGNTCAPSMLGAPKNYRLRLQHPPCRERRMSQQDKESACARHGGQIMHCT